MLWIKSLAHNFPGQREAETQGKDCFSLYVIPPGGASPHAAVAPKRMLLFKGLDQRQELGIALKLNLAGSAPTAYQSFF